MYFTIVIVVCNDTLQYCVGGRGGIKEFSSCISFETIDLNYYIGTSLE